MRIYLHYPLVMLLLLLTLSDDDLTIALHKGKCTCTSHHISRFVSYSHFSPSFDAFISFINSYYVPKSVSEALSISGCKNAMNKECWL